MAETSGRSMRVRKEVNYTEPAGNTGLVKYVERTSKGGDSDTSESDDDELPPLPSKGGSAAKRRVNTSLHAKHTSPAPSKNLSISGDSLFGIVRDKPTAVPMAVTKWWQDFVVIKEFAVQELANMVIEASGSKERLPQQVFKGEDSDVDDAVRGLVNRILDGYIDTYMSGNDKSSKKLRERLADFWRKLIHNAPRECITNLQSNPICAWLFAFSTAQLPVLRISATLAGLEMLVGVAGVGTEVLEDISNKHRQLDAARASSNESHASKQKKQRLSEELQMLGAEKAMLEAEMEDLFNAIFVHRHRDSDKLIRARCLTALGEVVTLYKPKFLNNQYLKYLGWGLNDKQAEVRCAALDAIAEIYQSDNTKELDGFTARFKDRMITMRFDKDINVAVRAMKVSMILCKHSREDISGDQMLELYSMITESDEELRTAAAELISAVYIEGDLVGIYQQNSGKGNKKKNDQTVFLLKGVVELLHQVAWDLEDLTPIFDSLVDANESWGWQDLGLMCKVLEEEDGEAITTEEKQTLAKMMVASLKLTTERADAEEAALTQKKDKERGKADDMSSSTSQLISSLPGLMTALGAETGTLTLLFKVVSALNLQHISPGHVKALTKVVSAISEAVTKGQDTALLKAAGEALGHLHSPQCEAKDMLSSELAMLADTLAKQFVPAAAALAKGSKPAMASLMGLKRTALIAGYVDLHALRPSFAKEAMDVVLAVAKHPDAAQNQNAGRHAILIATHTQNWRTARKIREDIQQADPSCFADRDSLLAVLGDISSDPNSSLSLRTQALTAVVDVVHFNMGQHGKSEGVKRKDIAKMGQVIRKLQEEDVSSQEVMAACDALYENVGDFMDDSIDKSGFKRVLAMGLKTLSQAADAGNKSEDAEVAAEMMSALALRQDYSLQWYNQLVLEHTPAEVFRQAADDNAGAEKMLLMHQKMYMRIISAASHGTPSDEVQDLSMRMVESVSVLDDLFTPSARLLYIRKAMEWSFSKIPQTLGFLDAVSVHIRNLESEDARLILDGLEELCTKHRIDVRSQSNATNHIASFRHRLIEALGSAPPASANKSAKKRAMDSPAVSRGSRLSLSTPTNTHRSQIQGSDDENEVSPQAASSVKKRGRPPKNPSGEKQGKKARNSEPDMVDDEGFTAVRRR